MVLLHGSDISAKDVEWSIGRGYSLERFAGLCNAIAWAEGRAIGLNQLSFTERVYVKDNGIDGEWILDAPPGEAESPLVKPGLNVFQYKQRDISVRNRAEIVNGLKRNLKGAAEEVRKKTQQNLSQYVLYINIDLSHDQKHELEELIEEGYPEALQVQVIGAAELSAFLNNLPHLRSAFFATAKFMTWADGEDKHGKQKLLPGHVPLTGRLDELAAAQAAIDDPNTRVLVIAGPSGIGKTRMALCATENRPIETVFAVDPISISASDLLMLHTPGQHVVVVVEDPDFETAEHLANTALGTEQFKLVLTLPTLQATRLVNFGRDKRIATLVLDALKDEDAQKLLRAAGAKLDYSVESWIVEHAGGNPGILLTGAAIGPELRVQGAAFLEQVGFAFETKARRILGDRAVQTLRLLSLLTHVGVDGPTAQELQLIVSLFGNGIHAGDVLAELSTLDSTGFVRLTGSYTEVIPPAFANYCAIQQLKGRTVELTKLIAGVQPPGRIRLLRRLRQLRGDSVAAFWHELFGNQGPLKDLATALKDPLLMRLIAPAVPERMSDLIVRGLKDMGVEQRREIQGQARRELVWALDDLLFHTRTSEAALRSLALLAEVENENFANNATGVFVECFHPQHPQFPLPLGQRLEVVRDILLGRGDRGLRGIGLKAVNEAFQGHGGIMLRRSAGPEPLDAVPEITRGDLWEYWAKLLDVLLEVSKGPDQSLATEAIAILPYASAHYTLHAPPERGTKVFESLVTDVLDHRLDANVADLAGSLAFAIRGLRQREKENAQHISHLEHLLSRIENRGDFKTRVKRWVGAWETGEHTTDGAGNTIYRGEAEIRNLAAAASAEPRLLDDELLRWLMLPEAKRAFEFMHYVGKNNKDLKVLPKLEAAAHHPRGEAVFASYMGGVASWSPDFVRKRLDEITQEGQICAEAVVSATRFVPGDAAAVKRVQFLIKERKLDPVLVERTLLSGGWMNTLSCDEAYALLSAIAGANLEQAPAVIDFLAMWVHSGKPIEGKLEELAWACFEHAPSVSTGEAYDFDLVASALAKTNTERAFALLETLLRQPYHRASWSPMDRFSGNQFWTVLWQSDRSRVLTIVLTIAAEDPLQRWRVAWHLPEMLDQQADAEFLTSYSVKNEQNAELIAESITGKKTGFWPIAVQVLAAFPENQRIKGAIAGGAEHMNQVVVGPTSEHLTACAKEIDNVLADASIPDATKPFLRELLDSFQKRAEKERHNELDESVNM
jgi:hypothetical protein